MREVTQEEVAQRLDRAEREHRSLRRVGAVVLLGIAAGALMGHMHPAGKTVEPNNLSFGIRPGSSAVSWR